MRFLRLDQRAVIPLAAHAGDAGLDLRCLEPFRIAPGERSSVGTGLAVEIPEGYAGLVLPRSGLALKHGVSLVNSPGLIDSGYRGEIRVLLLNTDSEEPFEAAAGDRIAQLMIVEHPRITPIEATELGGSDRGEGGFGSTGS